MASESNKPGDQNQPCQSITYNKSAFGENVCSTPPNKTRGSSDLAKYKKFVIASLAISSVTLAIVVILVGIIFSKSDMRHIRSEPDTAVTDEVRALVQTHEGGAKEEAREAAEKENSGGHLGLVGLKGAKGAPGLPGLNGLKGEPGLVIKGGVGDAGIVGPQGPKGDRGMIGIPGRAGMSGLDGLPGRRGDKGVSCASDFRRIRLIGGSSYFGRIEVLIDGRWGTVCDHNFGTNEASVACKELGYYGGSILDASSIPDGSLPTALDELACSGTESSLQDCLHNGAWSHDCGHSEDVGVICT